MPAATRRPRRLTDAQLEEMLALTGHADSVELKLTVPDSERRSTVAALGMDPLDAQIRQVFFFDTPDLRLNRQGVVVRARRVQGRGDDTVVKLRPIVPDELPASVRKAKTMVVEVDAMPGGYVCSASFKSALASPQVRQVAAGDRAIRKLYSKAQRAFYEAHAPDGLALLILWIARPARVDAAFDTWLLPLLGLIFLPFATLIYVLLYTPGRGVTGWDWFWVVLAALLDIGHWGAGASARNQRAGRASY